MDKAKENMNEIGEGNEGYVKAKENYDEIKLKRKKLRNNKSAINSRIEKKKDDFQMKKKIEERHLNLQENVKELSKKLTPEKKKDIMASLGKKDGI